MRLFHTLFLLTLCSLTYAQELKINYKYNSYDVDISDSLLIVSNDKKQINDTIFHDLDEDYYLTPEGLKVTLIQIEELKSTDPKLFSDINSSGQHYKSMENSSILSIVGPYISYSYEYYSEGGAHPSYGIGFTTYNIETKKNFSLLDFFSEEELYKVLINNEFILNYVNPTNATNLRQLRGEFFMNVEAKYSLDFYSFSFGEVKEDYVIINMGISHDAEVYRGNFEMISLQLTIPDQLKTILETSSKAGLLDVD
jgi:hypothetical protein